MEKPYERHLEIIRKSGEDAARNYVKLVKDLGEVKSWVCGAVCGGGCGVGCGAGCVGGCLTDSPWVPVVDYVAAGAAGGGSGGVATGVAQGY